MALWKNNLSPIVTQNSLIGMFEMSKSKKKKSKNNIKFKGEWVFASR